jgi:hypothetical protein
MVTILRRNVPVVCGASYRLLGYRISQDFKIRFRLQVKSYISDWLFSESRLLASYVSHHKAMAYDRVVIVIFVANTAAFHLSRPRQDAPLSHRHAWEAAGHVDGTKILQQLLLAGLCAAQSLWSLPRSAPLSLTRYKNQLDTYDAYGQIFPPFQGMGEI